MTPSLKQSLLAACSFDSKAVANNDRMDEQFHAFYLLGARFESSRLQPLLTALIDVAEAAYELSSKGVSVTRLNMQTEALARLEKLCGEGK